MTTASATQITGPAVALFPMCLRSWSQTRLYLDAAAAAGLG